MTRQLSSKRRSGPSKRYPIPELYWLRSQRPRKKWNKSFTQERLRIRIPNIQLEKKQTWRTLRTSRTTKRIKAPTRKEHPGNRTKTTRWKKKKREKKKRFSTSVMQRIKLRRRLKLPRRRSWLIRSWTIRTIEEKELGTPMKAKHFIESDGTCTNWTTALRNQRDTFQEVGSCRITRRSISFPNWKRGWLDS